MNALPPSTQDKARAWLQHANETWATLQRWPWWDTLRTLRIRFRDDRLGLTAGSLTFTTIISLVPLLTVMLALFTAFPMFSSFQIALEKYFLQSLIPPNIAKPVLGALTQFASKANRVGSVGLGVLVLTALALMLTIDRTLNAIWRVQRPRPIAQRVLVYWAALTLGPLLLGASLALTSYALSAGKGVVAALPGGLSFLLNLIEFVVLAISVAGLFHYVPNTHVRWRHAMAGGLFVAAGFELAKRALAWYVSQVPTYSTMYGAFASLPIFLVWIYLGWVIMLLGAVIAAYAPSLQMRVVRQIEEPGYRFELALRVLRQLRQARGEAAHGWSALELADRLQTDPLQLEPVLDVLQELDWIARLEEAGDQRLTLLCEPVKTAASPLLQALLLVRTPDLESLWRRGHLADATLADLLD
ncbi:MAG: YihY family inner membrane protein [Burkholderiaceae bacterium]|nr:YihY family inner membrane protein [Burkholderiaceae bacterium]